MGPRRRRWIPLGRVLEYWRAERRTIRQGLTALVVASMGNLVAGVTLGSITGTLELLPGLMVLLPAAIGMRGNIFGALGSRMGTSIHSGLFEASRRRGGVLQQNVYAATVLTFAVSLLLAVLAKILSSAFGIESITVIDFAVISILGGVLSSIVVGAFTAGLAVQAYRRGWDLDSVAAPLVTAVGDVVTIPALFAATFVVGLDWVTPTAAGLLTAVTVWLTVKGIASDLPATRRIVRESLPLLTLAGSVDVIAGLVLESRLEEFILFPALLVLIPPFLADAGALGAILASRLSSKLHLGALDPRARPQAVALLDITIVILFALWLFTLVGVSADLAARLFGLASPGLFRMIGLSLLAGLFATAAVVVVAYYAAVASFRIGFDPDNHGVPVITSSMDLVGVIALLMAIVLLGLH